MTARMSSYSTPAMFLNDTPAGAVVMGRTTCSSLESGGTIEHNEHSLMVGGESVGEADWTKLQAAMPVE
jgi:hypothetical protein